MNVNFFKKRFIDSDLSVYNCQLKSSDPRRNPEEILADKLFIFGLLIEGIAVVFFVAFKIPLETGRPNSETGGVGYIYFADIVKASNFRIAIYLAGLASLLFHQYFIRNTFKEINNLTTHNWKNNSKPFYFPDTLMCSSFEYYLRLIFFLILAVLVGEIPLLLITIEKIIHYYNHNSAPNVLYDFSTKIFIGACFLVSLIVVVWDICVLGALKQYKKSYDKDKYGEWDNDGINQVRVFTLTGILSSLLWGSVFIFTLTSNLSILNDIAYTFIFIHIAIVAYRIFGDKALKKGY